MVEPNPEGLDPVSGVEAIPKVLRDQGLFGASQVQMDGMLFKSNTYEERILAAKRSRQGCR